FVAYSIKTGIESCPNEILCEILELYQAESLTDARDGMADAFDWCSKWRRVIVNNPVFWQEIWTTWPPKIVELYETRSKNGPLRLFKFRDSKYHYDIEGNTTARLLALHRERIHTFYVEWRTYAHTGWEDLSKFMERAVGDNLFPRLTQLHLVSSYESVVRLKRLNAPMLRSIVLIGVILNPSTFPSLAHLTTLHSEHSKLTAEDLIALLEACPRIESCGIKFAHVNDPYRDPDSPTDSDPDPRSVLLPRVRISLGALQDLTIDGMHWSCMAKVLNHFDIPSAAKTELVPLIRAGEDKPSETLSAVVPSRDSLYNSIEVSSPTREITFYNSSTPGSFTFKISDKIQYHLSLCADITALTTSLTYLSLPSSIGIHLSSISIVGIPPVCIPRTVDIWAAFSSLPNIEKLSLLECRDTNDFFLAFKFDTETMPCPRLMGLDLRNSYFEGEVLLEFLRDRQEEDEVANIEWIRLVEGFFGEEILEEMLPELRSYVTVTVE
ncbi:hypothetical protein SISNIDRAFT_450364, partial [Sistotremastrum niveocremeum HHB9708]